MNSQNYFLYHLHTELSLLDSCTNYKLYIDKAKELGMTAICFSEHGNVFNWLEKKQYCEENGLKYVHGCEVYLTETLEEKIRDNYHTVLIAKNLKGFLELNELVSTSSDDDHKYFKPRITFDEFLNCSDNIISTSACLQSPLNKLDRNNPYYEKLIDKYDYLEIQPHFNLQEQIDYNKYLIELSKKYNKKLIVGTDTHSLDSYKAECRKLKKEEQNMVYDNEDLCDLTMKNYNELFSMFLKQGIDEKIIEEALNNTKEIENITEELVIDNSFKYPDLYKNEEEMFRNEAYKGLEEKIKIGAIKESEKQIYIDRIEEELKPYKKTGMCSFMLFMSELLKYAHSKGIPTSPSRGSCGGSLIAYLLDITDLDAIKWNTVFSRFVNEDRVSLGDIDLDFPGDSRAVIYDYIINRFGEEKTCYILTTNTMVDKGTIDCIVRVIYKDKPKQEQLSIGKKIKELYEKDPEKAKKEYSKVFYYFEGLRGTVVSIGIHPAGIVASPITLADNMGIHHYDGKIVSMINMEEIHDLNYVKYDILGLKNVAVIRDCCKYIGIPYPKTHEMDFEDEKVWNDIPSSPYFLFQFESPFSYDLLKKFKPKMINHLSLINASLRPSGASYRNDLIAGKKHKNIIEEMDELLKNNNGYLVFQEDVSAFLMNICGFSGSEADNMRRAIASKKLADIEKNIPKMIEGYMNFSKKDKEEAEKDMKEVVDVMIDASSYMFGYNHSTGYSILGYYCGYYRYYYPLEFTCSALNNADNEEDTVSGIELAKLKGITINKPKFGYSGGKYTPDKKSNSIYKGIGSIKDLNSTVGDELLQLSKENEYDNFLDLLIDIDKKTSCKKNQLDILIQLDFFDMFGKSKKLLEFVKYFRLIYNPKSEFKSPKKVTLERDIPRRSMLVYIERNSKPTETSYSKLNWRNALNDIWNNIRDEELSFRTKLDTQRDKLGYIDYTNDKLEKRCVLITSINTNYTPVVDTYCLNNGKTCRCKIKKSVFKNKEIKEGDVIYAQSMQRKTGWKKVGEKPDGKPIFEEDKTKIEWWINSYNILDIDEILE